jgi:crotonobetainyl-CoA:carnitine CoA-transferase CaiB-like acyl-CoA transferase
MFVTIHHPTAGDMKICGNQIKLSETPVNFAKPAPLLGEHTCEILAEFGYSEAAIAKFKEDRVV